MKTLGEVLTLSVQYLEKQGLERPRRCVEDLLAHSLGVKRLDLYMQFDRPLVEAELTLFRELLKRKAQREPVQYILKEVDFFRTKLEVTPDVLIPRHETEILVEKVYNQIKDRPGEVVWDICTGSGSVAISLKKALPQKKVCASDLSEAALSVAKKNAQRNGVEINFYQGDLLMPFKGQKADFIICNPPYISEKEYFELEPEVRLFEPKSALVGGNSGLEFYERLAREMPEYLQPGGLVFLELGTGQGEAVKNIFHAQNWKAGRLEKDWAGHDRFFFLENE